jgi:hypothetical protein
MSHSVRPTRQRLRPYSTTTAAMATLDSKHRRPPAHPPVLVTCRAPGSSLCDGASDHTSTTASSYYTLTAEEQQQRKTAWAPCSDDHSTGPDDVIHHVIDLDDDDLEWFEDEDDEDNEEGTKRREKLDDSPFVPIDTSFWIIDEVEICRGLAGYQEGCEPSNIHHVSVLGEEFAEEGLDDDEDDSHGPSQRTPYAKSSCATPHCRNPPSNVVHRPASQLMPRGRAVGRHPITMASGHLCTASVGRHSSTGRHPPTASRNLSVDRKPVGRAASVSTASVRNPRTASVDRSTASSINPPLRKPANVSSRAAVPRPPPSPKTSQSKMHYETSSLGRPRSAVPPPRTSGAPPRGGGAPRQQFLV